MVLAGSVGKDRVKFPLPAYEAVAKDRVDDWDGELEFERTVLWLVVELVEENPALDEIELWLFVLAEEYPELDVLELWLVDTLDREEEPLVGTTDEAVMPESRPLGFA